MSGLGDLATGLATLATPELLFHAAWATLLGIFVGSLPGLTATMGVALMTTLTYSLDSTTAILVLICMYVGAIYGGSRSAILLNIPGTPASAATSLDGYPLAREGRAGYAMGLATAGSALGTFVGVLMLVLVAPPLAEAALNFGSFEFFWLAVFGILISGQLTADTTPIKGYIAGILGLAVAMIGSEGIHAHVRFSMGVTDLNAGIALIPAMVGAFGFAEVLTAMWNRRGELASKRDKSRTLPELMDLWRYKFTIARSGIIGTFVGIIPGVGEDIGAWASYATAGSLIPAITLAVPGSASSAVLIAAFFIHGIRPGPLIMIEQPHFVGLISAMVLIATVFMAIYGLALTRVFVQVLRVPYAYLMPVVFVLCVIGTYALSQRIFDIYIMVFFGLVGFVLRQMKYPMAPLVLGIILGDLLDKSLRRGLTLSDGDLMPFFTRPVSAIFVALIVLSILFNLPAFRRLAMTPVRWITGRGRA